MRNILVRAVVAALGLIALTVLVIDWNSLVLPGGTRRTNDATLQGDPTQLKARVAGYLAEVPAADYATVHKGDLLYAIDDRDYRARSARAAASVAQAEAAVAVAQTAIVQQAAQIEAAEADLQAGEAGARQSHLERVRQDQLRNTESFLARAWEDAVAADQRQQAGLDGYRRALAAQRAQSDVLEAQLKAQQATLAAQRAALAAADVELGYTRITAPFDGILSQRLARRGDYAAAGTSLITIVPLAGAWAVANFREVQLDQMRPGQAARVTVDAIPGVTIDGRVDSVQPGSQASASAMPPDRAAGNFTKIVQRVPVKIVLDMPANLAGRLRPGLSAEVEVDTTTSPSPLRGEGRGEGESHAPNQTRGEGKPHS